MSAIRLWWMDDEPCQRTNVLSQLHSSGFYYRPIVLMSRKKYGSVGVRNFHVHSHSTKLSCTFVACF